jgi:hypothetical protein
MDEQSLRTLLETYKADEADLEEVLRKLRSLPFQDLGFAKIDHHRDIRCGFPEVIYGAGKTIEQVLAIAEARLASGGNLLVTRATDEMLEALPERFPSAECCPTAHTVTVRQHEARLSPGTIAIVAAGTSDLPVAEEARVTCQIMDQQVATFYDVGVAGIHRLLAYSEALQAANVLVVVAGMEGALASVVGGLVDKPVIAVPTSVGYGASFQGLAALLAMLNSCASGVAVVNIDNGFAGGYVASLINRSAGGS